LHSKVEAAPGIPKESLYLLLHMVCRSVFQIA
jgi:hypothetical protein